MSQTGDSKPPIKIHNTAQAAKEIANRSGNRLLGEVVGYFREKGWTTRISQYYVDATTAKARELDLIVEKAFQFADSYQQKWNHLHVRLCIECKYIRRPVVFWFDDIDQKSVKSWVDRTAPFTSSHSSSRQLHYLIAGKEGAKLFASGAENEDSEPIFRAINQCLNGFVNTRHRPLVELPSRASLNRFTLAYPLIVLSSFDSVYRTHINGSPDPVKVEDNFLLEVNYAYPKPDGAGITEYFLVDMVSLGTLDKYLAGIDREVEAAKLLA